MKIGFTGAQGTGKSTLVEELLQIFPEYSRHTNISRKFSKEIPGFKINRDAGVIEQSILLGGIALDVLTADNIIADRSIIDALAYTEINKNISREHKDVLFDMFNSISDKYDFIFYTPIEFTPENDGIRDMDVNYREMVDKTIKNLLIKTSCNWFEIRGSVDERMSKIKEIIR